MIVLIGTKNETKIKGAKCALDKYFNNVELIGVDVSSGVASQPVGDEIYEGAKNRVENIMSYAKEKNLDVDYFLAVESGIIKIFDKWFIVSLAIIKDKFGYESFGLSSAYPVPNRYVKQIINSDLGKVMESIFCQNNLDKMKGGINCLSHGIINRINLTCEAFLMALTQFINHDIWKDKI